MQKVSWIYALLAVILFFNLGCSQGVVPPNPSQTFPSDLKFTQPAGVK